MGKTTEGVPLKWVRLPKVYPLMRRERERQGKKEKERERDGARGERETH